MCENLRRAILHFRVINSLVFVEKKIFKNGRRKIDEKIAANTIKMRSKQKKRQRPCVVHKCTLSFCGASFFLFVLCVRFLMGAAETLCCRIAGERTVLFEI